MSRKNKQSRRVYLERAEYCSEDVDLHGLLSLRLGLLDALTEVLQHLQAVLVGHAREDQPVETHGAVDHCHAQWQRTRDVTLKSTREIYSKCLETDQLK